jgi:NDP-sugar pyrophosphorylase family protein
MNGARRNLPASVILAGTHPWTNSPFDRLMPRALLPVAHRPLISYALAWLNRGGIADVTICGNRETRLLRDWFERQVPSDAAVAYQEDPMPRGTAGSIHDAAVASGADTFVVADGTAVPNVDIADLLLKHRESEAGLTVVVHSEAVQNGGQPLLVPSGIYVVDRQALSVVPASGFYDLKEELIPELYRSGERIVAYVAPDAPPRVLGASSYLVVNDWMVEHLAQAANMPGTPGGYLLRATGLVHREAEVAADAVLVGPVIIGPGARVKARAVIIGPASIGCDATVERGAVVSRSAIWRRSRVGEHASTDRCIAVDDAVVTPYSRTLCSVLVPETGASPPADAARARLSTLETASPNTHWKPQRVLIGAR